jgi:4-amino-4-deoxy-L-arabinose transferase-like glycosyltransferase
MPARASRLILLAITLLAFALRVLTLLNQSLWRDEVDALLFATQPLDQFVAMFRQPGQNGPLFFLALGPWLSLAGHGEFALRFPAALAGVVSVPLLYALVARLTGRTVGLVAALLMATAPYGVWYGQEAKMYALLTVLIPASLLAVTGVARHNGRRTGRLAAWGGLYILTTLSFYTHLLAVLALPVQVIWLLALPGARTGLRVRNTALYLLALALPYVPFLRWAPQAWTSSFTTGHPFVPLGDIAQVLAGAFSRGVLGAEPATLLPYMVALVAGCLVWPLSRRAAGGGQTRRWRVVLLLLAWLALPPVLIYVVSLGMPIFTDRYLIWAMPAFLALLACGIVALADEWRPLGIAVGAAILALNGWSLYLQATQPIKADFRAAAAYLAQRIEPDDALMYQIPYNRYTLTYYAGGRRDPRDPAWQGVDGPYTNAGMSEAEADAWMATRLGSAEDVWLVLSEAGMWDRRDLTGQWLAANAEEVERTEFARVTVIRYRR